MKMTFNADMMLFTSFSNLSNPDNLNIISNLSESAKNICNFLGNRTTNEVKELPEFKPLLFGFNRNLNSYMIWNYENKINLMKNYLDKLNDLTTVDELFENIHQLTSNNSNI